MAGSKPGAVRSVVLGKIGRLTPRWSGEIHRMVEDDWGTITQRSVQRAIAGLIAAGEVRRTEDGYLLVRARASIAAQESA